MLKGNYQNKLETNLEYKIIELKNCYSKNRRRKNKIANYDFYNELSDLKLDSRRSQMNPYFILCFPIILPILFIFEI